MTPSKRGGTPQNRGCCHASRERISALTLQRKILKATPTWESTQNPGMFSPHSTLGQAELKGRGGWGTLELRPSMLSTGLQMGSRCPGLLTLRLARKGNTFLPQLLGLRSQQLPESRGGGASPSGPPTARGGCQAGGRTGKKGPLNSAWVLACKGHGWICTLPAVSPRSHLAAWHSLLRTNGTGNEVGLWLPGYSPPASLALTVPG